MAAHIPLLLFLLLSSITKSQVIKLFAAAGEDDDDVSNQTTGVYSFNCSDKIKKCNAVLYQSNGLPPQRISSLYSVNASQIKPITHFNGQDYLVTVPCSCENVSKTVGYFYDTHYVVKSNDTFGNVSGQLYSGQAWEVGGERESYVPNKQVPIHLTCGCVESESQVVVTYTVQEHDTLSYIASLLSAQMDQIQSLNKNLTKNLGFIAVGWVLFVPMEKNGIPSPKKKMEHKWTIVIAVLSAVALLSTCSLAVVLIIRRRRSSNVAEYPKSVSKTLSSKRALSLRSQYLNKEDIEDIPVFESERPVIYSLEEIVEATNDFAEARKIGQGGYGSVYFGVLGDQEVAIKKMRSTKSKEFLAELKVLCKIHHINVVELLGYASGDDHLYLVYEYIPNGSLSEHLHDPLLKGHQPLSWTARTQVAVDAAKGIEYIHDHTKARYVHRDIKTTNILLDEGLRAKVADFGLAKLVGRSNEDEAVATRLVGTLGYLPPESVKELQVTTKTDVFAFGVVLAELITGQRALTRDGKEPHKLKSLITVVYNIFQAADPEVALESIIDGNLKGRCPLEDVFKMAEIAEWCMSEEAIERPEMGEIVITLSQIMVSSVEWEASLGGNSPVFSGIFDGR